MRFVPADVAPLIWRPATFPNPISLIAGPPATIYYKIPAPCSVRIEVIQDDDVNPGVTLVRTLQDWTPVGTGTWSVTWNGLNDAGTMVEPGIYFAHVMGYNGNGVTHATSWIVVNP